MNSLPRSAMLTDLKSGKPIYNSESRKKEREEEEKERQLQVNVISR